jgi:hypothetical protein
MGNRWSTSIVVDSFPTCLKGLLYELVTVSPDKVINGHIERIITLGPGPSTKSGPAGCSAFSMTHLIKIENPDFLSIVSL